MVLSVFFFVECVQCWKWTYRWNAVADGNWEDICFPCILKTWTCPACQAWIQNDWFRLSRHTWSLTNDCAICGFRLLRRQQLTTILEPNLPPLLALLVAEYITGSSEDKYYSSYDTTIRRTIWVPFALRDVQQ